MHVQVKLDPWQRQALQTQVVNLPDYGQQTTASLLSAMGLQDTLLQQSASQAPSRQRNA